VSDRAQHPPRTTLTVGFVVGVSPDKWARVWSERMPGATLELRPVDAEHAVAALEADLDMVLARDAGVGDDELHAIELWRETQVAVAPKDHPIKLFDAVTTADLDDENLIAGSDDAALDLVAAGVGIVRMPQSVLRATGRRDVIGRPISDATPTQIALVWPRDRDHELIQEFIGIVRGRTANSSRGSADLEPPAEVSKRPDPQSKRTSPKPSPRKAAGRAARPKRGGRSGRR